jgi:hypothetical protein
MVPYSLNFDTRWEWSASCPGPLIPGEGATDTHWIGGWVNPRANLDVVAKRKSPYPCQESNPGCPAHSLVTILTELSQLCSYNKL